MSAQKPREIAAQILRHRRQGTEFVEDILENAFAQNRLSSADRGLCQELVYGVIRWQVALDWLIARKTAGGREQKPGLQDLLRLGLYQIFFLDRIPDHAAVNETVEMAKRGDFRAQAGFVNAVLRGYLRERDATRQALTELKKTQPHLGWSHPEWLVSCWQKRWGADKTAQLLEWNNTPPKTFARVNPLKTHAEKLLPQWLDENVEYDFVRRDWLEDNLIFELKSHPPLTKLPSFQQGMFYLQDPGTLLAVRELNPQPGETILDLCAAPGGKTTFIAQLMRNEGEIVACDVSPERLQLVEQNCLRLGVTCVETVVAGILPAVEPGVSPGGKIADSFNRAENSGFDPGGRMPPSTAGGTPAATIKRFDRILVDAPCSNTGVMRRRVDLRWRIQPEEIERLRNAQLDLLRRAAALLKPDGVLVYSTCSLEPEENGDVVKEFLSGQSGFKLEHDRLLLPFADGVDGAFTARLRKVKAS